MPQPELLASLLSRRTIASLISDVLALGLLMLADGWILVRLSRVTGVYLALALEAAVAVLAIVVVGSTINSEIRRIRDAAVDGRYRPRDYARLAASLAAALLLVLPGFASDALGALIYAPPGRQLFGWWFLRRYRSQLPVVYEYLKLSVFSFDASPPDDVSAAPALQKDEAERSESP